MENYTFLGYEMLNFMDEVDSHGLRWSYDSAGAGFLRATTYAGEDKLIYDLCGSRLDADVFRRATALLIQKMERT